MTISKNLPSDGRIQPVRIKKIWRNESVLKGNPDDIQSSGAVRMSGGAGKVNEILRMIRDVPEVREDKIEALRYAIASGTYSVYPLEIAGKIIDEAQWM